MRMVRENRCVRAGACLPRRRGRCARRLRQTPCMSTGVIEDSVLTAEPPLLSRIASQDAKFAPRSSASPGCASGYALERTAASPQHSPPRCDPRSRRLTIESPSLRQQSAASVLMRWARRHCGQRNGLSGPDMPLRHWRQSERPELHRGDAFVHHSIPCACFTHQRSAVRSRPRPLCSSRNLVPPRSPIVPQIQTETRTLLYWGSPTSVALPARTRVLTAAPTVTYPSGAS